MRWVAGVTAALALWLAFATGAERNWGWEEEAPALSRSVERGRVLLSQVRALRDAQQVTRAELAVARWRSVRREGTSGVVVDPGVPAAAGTLARREALAELDALGIDPSRLHVYVTRELLPADSLGRGGQRAAVSATWLLPRPGVQEPCTALIQLRDVEPAQLGILETMSLAGPCAYYARFGAPGPRMRAWMDTVRFSFAGMAAWGGRPGARGETQLLPVGTGGRRMDRRVLSFRGMSCLMSSDDDCHVLVGLAHSPERARVPGDAATLPPDRTTDIVQGSLGAYGARFGLNERWLFSQLVRDHGTERFARFWTSAASPDAAFQEVYGEPIARWVRGWLSQRYDDSPGGPRFPMAPGISALIVVTACLAWSVFRPNAGRTA